jgi:Tfp pilus assembly protein PilF
VVRPALTEKSVVLAPTPSAGSDDVRSRCRKAVAERRNKGILASCAEAFEADPGAVDIAILLAKTEFDRGHTAQAYVWGKKAIAADPNAADAYVFIGGAEQTAGHSKAAKEAYKRYLQMAPSGRYAADLRAIVGSL